MVNTFEGLLALLVENNVAFIVVGGVAVCLNGFVRTTEDLDVLVENSPSNIRKLLSCLVQFGQGFASELTPEDFTDEEGAIRIREDFDLDIFVRMRGRKYADLLNMVGSHEMADGTRIPYLKAEGLVILKQGSVREKDRIDTAALAELTRAHRPPDLGIEGMSLDSLRPESGNEDPDGNIRP